MKSSSSDNNLLRKLATPSRVGSNRTYNYLARSPEAIVMDAARKQLENCPESNPNSTSMLRRQASTTVGSSDLHRPASRQKPLDLQPDRMFKRFEYLMAKLTAEVDEQPAIGILEHLKEQYRRKKARYLASNRGY